MNPIAVSVAPFLIFAGLDATPAQDELSREQQFEKLMSGVQLVGHFTTTGRTAPAQEESYTISKVTWRGEDRFQFDAKVEYGTRSVTVPIVVLVKWAGDTPMIQVTDMTIPLLGTYSARVLIYRGEYAGTWSGGDHGGQMYGKIVPVEESGNGSGQEPGGWSNWRGPSNTGVAAAGNPPTVWSETQNVRWKTPIPGLGSSSPVVWGDRIYVTTAIETDREGEAPVVAEPPQEQRGGNQRRRRGGRSGRGGRGGGRGEPLKVHEWAVYAIDRNDGSIVWNTIVAEAVPHERGQQNNSQASYSPITDGERIYASFGSRGLHCLDMNGEVLWSKDFGQMQTYNGFGEGSSPALYGDTLVLNWDHQGDSFITALDKRTGEEIWRRDRDEGTSWSTPLIVEVDGRAQVITTATSLSRAYDLETGELVWTLPGMTRNSIPSPSYADGVAYLMSGYRGNMLQAVRLAGAKGDISDTGNVLWSYARNTSYVPSQLLYGDFIYFMRDNNAVLTCLDARTGEVHYEGLRLEGMREVYSSPVGANGRVYIVGRDGVSKVIKLGAEYEEIATNTLDDGFDSTAAIVGDDLYLRGRANLYCISEQSR